MIDAEDAFARMGADVMRWQYCAQPPDRNLLFGFGPGHEIKRKLLTLWNSVGFLVTYGNIEGFEPTLADLETGPPVERPLDRWLVERTHEFVHEATAGYEATLTVDVIRAFEAFVDDLSNWYIRRSRRRFYGDDDGGVPDALVRARAVAARGRAGDAVPHRAPLAEPRPRAGRRRSSSPAGPSRPSPTGPLLDEIARGAPRRRARPQRARDLGPEAAPAAAAARRRGRRRRGGARGRDRRRAAREGGRVRHGRGLRAAREAEPAACSGRSSGRQLGEVREALAAGRVRGARRRPLPGERPRARAGRGARRARRPRGLGGRVRGRRHRRARHVARRRAAARGARQRPDPRRADAAQGRRGLEIVDRIRLWIPDAELLPFADRIAAETLAVSVELGDELRLEKA